MRLRSLYRETKEEQFEMIILGETETEYMVQMLPKWQKEFQEGNSIQTLRKCLIGKDRLYEIINDKTYEQLTLF